MEFESGRPFNVISGSDRSRRGLGSTTDRAKLTGQPLAPPSGLGSDAVVQPGGVRRGRCRHVRRRAEGLSARPVVPQLEHGTVQELPVQRLDMNVQFRIEFFNVFNQVNFDIPGYDAGRQPHRGQQRQLRPDHADGSGHGRSATDPVRLEVPLLGRDHAEARFCWCARGGGRRIRHGASARPGPAGSCLARVRDRDGRCSRRPADGRPHARRARSAANASTRTRSPSTSWTPPA